MMIENAYHGSAFGSTCIHNGRVDQLEDRYLGMVEAPSSNLGTSTPLFLININGFGCTADNCEGLDEGTIQSNFNEGQDVRKSQS